MREQMYKEDIKIDAKKIGRSINSMLIEQGMSVQNLVDYLNVTPQAVYKWIHGESRPSLECLVGIAGCLGVTTDEILGTNEILRYARERAGGYEMHGVF